MSEFDIHYSVAYGMKEKEIESKNKYTRFMAFTREWLCSVLETQNDGQTEYEYFETDGKRLKDGWFKKIMKVKNGKEPGFDFPRANGPEYITCVYDTFMPAYRALKESFGKRSIWQWFTNHAQYTAERDAIKAIEGTMMALTGEAKESIDGAYGEYCKQVPNYEPKTVDQMEKVFEAQPKVRVPVRDSQRIQYEKVVNEHGFDRQLRSAVYEEMRRWDTMDELRVSSALRIAGSFDISMSNFANQIDWATVESPEEVARQAENQARSTFYGIFGRLRRDYVPAKDALIIAQKITDIALKAHFPSLFKDGKYANLADNYILGDKERFTAVVNHFDSSDLRVDDREAFANEVYNEFHNIKESAPNTEPVAKTDAVQTEVKPEEPKPEANEIEETKSEIEENKPEIEVNNTEIEENKIEEPEFVKVPIKVSLDAPAKEPAKGTATPPAAQSNSKLNDIRFGCRGRAQSVMESKYEIAQIEKKIKEALTGKASKSVLNSNLISKITQSMFDASDKINRNFDDLGAAGASLGKIEGYIQVEIQNLFQNAYRSLKSCGLQPKDQVVAAQKISDVIINNVTPVAFNGNAFEKYGKNYAINDPDMVVDVLSDVEGCDKNICHKITEEARTELLHPVRERVAFNDENKSIDAPVSEKITGDRAVTNNGLNK